MSDAQGAAAPQSASTPTQEELSRREKETLLRQKNANLEVYEQAMAVQTQFMNPNVWTQIRAMGKVFFESKAIPSSIQNEAQLVMVLQAGFEAGMTPIESLHSLYIVNGSINVWGKAVTKRLRDHGWKIVYSNESDTACTATVSKGEESYTETYEYVMAEKSGYTKTNAGGEKIGWKLGINRKLKLRYGVLSLIIKSYIPEVLGNFNDIKEVAEDTQIEAPPVETRTPEAPKKTIEASSLAEKIAQQREKKAIQDAPAVVGKQAGIGQDPVKPEDTQ